MEGGRRIPAPYRNLPSYYPARPGKERNPGSSSSCVKLENPPRPAAANAGQLACITCWAGNGQMGYSLPGAKNPDLFVFA